MLDAAPGLSAREIGVAEIAIDRARRIAPIIGPDPLHWLAAVLRRYRSFSNEGRVAGLLAALRPVRAVVYLRAVAAPLHLSVREVREAIRALETSGFLRTAPTIRTEALEITLPKRPDSAAGRATGGPLAKSARAQARKRRRRPAAS